VVIVGQDVGNLKAKRALVGLHHLAKEPENLLFAGVTARQRAERGVCPGDVVGEGG
jgi:hypothetical protein